MEINVVPLEDKHIQGLWDAVQGCPDFFADDLSIDNFEKFRCYLLDEVTDVLVGVRGGEVLGCAYLESLDIGKGFACIALFTKRGSMTPEEIFSITKANIPYYFKKYNLNMLYLVIRNTNKAMLKLAKALGFLGLEVLKDYQQVKGKWTDYVIKGIIKENLEGGGI